MRSTKGSIATRSLRMALIMLLSFLVDLSIETPLIQGSSTDLSRVSYCSAHETSSHHSDPARLSFEKGASEEIEVASHKRKADADTITTAPTVSSVVIRRRLWALRDENTLLSCPIELLTSSLHSQGPPRV